MMNKVRENYNKQLKFYQEMLDIGLEQEKAIQIKDYKRLLSLIKKRKKIIEKIDMIRENSPSLSVDPDREVQDVVRKIIHLLERILTQEKKNESLLKKSIQNTFSALQQLDRAKLLRKAYRGFSQPDARFLDERK